MGRREEGRKGWRERKGQIEIERERGSEKIKLGTILKIE